MKKLLALVLSLLLVASSFALVALAGEETTAAEGDTTVAEGDTTVAEGDTTEPETPAFSNTLLKFDENAKAMKVLTAPNSIDKHYYSTETSEEQWEGAKLLITDVGDPFITINWSTYIKKSGLQKVDSQSYPFVVIKLRVDGYVDDFELFYCAGSVTGASPDYFTPTDYPCESSGEIEYIIYDLTDDCEGNYNMFRFDPVSADEDTAVYLYELALFATEEEAFAYAGFNGEDEETTEEPSDEETTEEPTEAPTEIQTAAPVVDDGKKDCNSVISVGTVLVSIIALGVVCIKKKD